MQPVLNAKVYCFDNEFPVKSITNDSKDSRRMFLERIQAEEEGKWIIVDDTCHFRSMQKRYLKASDKGQDTVQVVFLYISASNDQITELKSRNTQRVTNVTNEQIDKMTRFLNSSKNAFPNVIEYNFGNVPSVLVVAETIQRAFDNYKKRIMNNERVVDIESGANFFNQLNLALNKQISESFKSNPNLDGKQVSAAKKAFVANVNTEMSIEDLTEIFREQHLF